MSGRMGALKTAGRAWVEPLALPSPPMMPTVGRPDILKNLLWLVVWCWRRLSLRSELKSRESAASKTWRGDCAPRNPVGEYYFRPLSRPFTTAKSKCPFLDAICLQEGTWIHSSCGQQSGPRKPEMLRRSHGKYCAPTRRWSDGLPHRCLKPVRMPETSVPQHIQNGRYNRMRTMDGPVIRLAPLSRNYATSRVPARHRVLDAGCTWRNEPTLRTTNHRSASWLQPSRII